MITYKAKRKPKKEESYTRTITFKYEPTFEEREGMIRRAIYQEQDNKKNKNLRWIIVEKTMQSAKIKFFRKQTRKKKCEE